MEPIQIVFILFICASYGFLIYGLFRIWRRSNEETDEEKGEKFDHEELVNHRIKATIQILLLSTTLGIVTLTVLAVTKSDPVDPPTNSNAASRSINSFEIVFSNSTDSNIQPTTGVLPSDGGVKTNDSLTLHQTADCPPATATSLIDVCADQIESTPQAAKGIQNAKEIVRHLHEGKLTNLAPKINLNVNFDYDTAELSIQGKKQVFELEKVMSTEYYSHFVFKLIGHTDKRGGESYNQELSESRAKSVKQELVTLAPILESKITTQGLGEVQLLHRGESEEEHSRNRRVEVHFVTI